MVHESADPNPCGLVVTLAMQPVRLYEYVRWRWYNRKKHESNVKQMNESTI